MYLTIFDEVDQNEPELGAIDAASLYREFEKVKDGRGKKGKRYPLPLLLTLLLLGKLAGETTINGIVDWIKERKGSLKGQLQWPKSFPVNSTYSHALAQCDGQEIAQAIAHVNSQGQSHAGRWNSTESRRGSPGGEAGSYSHGWESDAGNPGTCPSRATLSAFDVAL